MSVKKRNQNEPREKKEILAVFAQKGKMSLTEIWEITGFNPNTIRGVCVRLTKEGELERIGKGIYKIKEPH